MRYSDPMNTTNFLRIISLLVLLGISPLFISAQELGPDEELYLRDPDPRFHGSQVLDLQRMLLFYGQDIGSDGMDGWFGRDTHNALLGFQEMKGMETNGRIAVKDIQINLEWAPTLLSTFNRGMEEGPFPSADNEAREYRSEPGKALTISNYYGRISIPAEEIEKQHYSVFTLSPEGRFLATMGMPQNESREWVGNHIKVWDILTGETRIIHACELAVDPSTEGLLDGYSYPWITEYFWYRIGHPALEPELRLLAMTEIADPSGERILSVMLLYPLRYDNP